MNIKWITTGVLLLASSALAEIKVGVILSLTGAAASLGIAERNALAFLPTTIGGEKVTYLVEDDASDKNRAIDIANRFFEQNVDIIIGPTLSANSIVLLDLLPGKRTPMISLAAAESIIKPVDEKRRWAFKTPQTDAMMAGAIAQHMAANGVKTVGFAGVNDAYGQGWLTEFGEQAARRGIKVVSKVLWDKAKNLQGDESRAMLEPRPDAVLIAASGAAGAPPQKLVKAQGYAGQIYQTHGVANPEFLVAAGREAEGVIVPVGPIMVAEQLPDNVASKTVAADFVRRYEEKYGALSRSPFAAHMYDAGLILAAAAPRALKSAKPGTVSFRNALRAALETTRGVVGTHGVFNFSPTDHLGLDDRSFVMIKAVGTFWGYLKK